LPKHNTEPNIHVQANRAYSKLCFITLARGTERTEITLAVNRVGLCGTADVAGMRVDVVYRFTDVYSRTEQLVNAVNSVSEYWQLC